MVDKIDLLKKLQKNSLYLNANSITQARQQRVISHKVYGLDDKPYVDFSHYKHRANEHQHNISSRSLRRRICIRIQLNNEN